MRWINHEITSFSIGFAVSGNVLFGAMSAAAATIPDALEMGIGRLFFRHRGISHNPLLWLPMCIIIYFLVILYAESYAVVILGHLPKVDLSFLTSHISIAAGGFIIGIIAHLFTDALSIHGIPLWKSKRLAVGFYKTFTVSEYKTAGGIIAICSTGRFLFN